MFILSINLVLLRTPTYTPTMTSSGLICDFRCSIVSFIKLVTLVFGT